MAVRLRSIRPDWGALLIVAALGLATSVVVLLYAANGRIELVKFNDFYREAWPAYAALGHGHVLEFLKLGPIYVGSLVLRAPFALIASALGGGRRAVYVASALPCMIAATALCTWLAAQPRRRGGIGWASRVVPIVCCVINPVVLVALFGGHPEEVLGAALCVGAVILAVKERAGWAGVLVGLAVANKTWAVVAVPVVIAAMPASRRRALLVAGLAAGAVLLPIAIATHQHGVSANVASTQIGTIFNPSQLLWWFGPHSWLANHAREVIVFAAIGCAALWNVRQVGDRDASDKLPDALLLLALVFLLRAALDPWDNLYYHVPFLFALVAYEVSAGRPPILTVFYTVALNIVATINGVPHMSADLRSALYAMTVVPTIAWFAMRLYLPDWAPHGRLTSRVATRPQPDAAIAR
jgi:hypothetical protein